MAWADLTDCRAYYELIGEGEPLLLIPGLGATCRLWDPIVPELARHFTLIMLDNRGMGLSKAKKKPRTLADYSADYAELLDFLNVDQSHVLGLSLGGIAAQRLAIDHPQKIKRLILMSCADRFAPYLLRITALLGHSLRRFPRMLFLQTMELLATALGLDDELAGSGIAVLSVIVGGQDLHFGGNVRGHAEVGLQADHAALVHEALNGRCPVDNRFIARDQAAVNACIEGVSAACRCNAGHHDGHRHR